LHSVSKDHAASLSGVGPTEWERPFLYWVSANTSRTVSCQYVPNSGGLQFA
jgi:hypothetical protein